MLMNLMNPYQDRFGEHIAHNCARGLPLAQHNSAKTSKRCVIAGTAPTLMVPKNFRELRDLVRDKKHHLFAIKGAIDLLLDAGLPVKFAVSMDPTPEETGKTPAHKEVVYYVASVCHPSLFDKLLSAGCEVRLFHSACGIPQEIETYRRLSGTGDVIMGGYTVVNRALGLTKYLGYTRNVIAGAMFGWREGDSYYAPGINAQAGNFGPQFDDAGKVDGKVWYTRLDLMMSALHLAPIIKAGQARVIGDSLAVGLSRKDQAFWDRVAKKTAVPVPGQQSIQGKSAPEMHQAIDLGF